MDFSDVKNIKSLSDWKSGKRYSFVYNGFSYIVYELDNGEIQSICTEYKRTKIYERGYKPLDYKDFEPESAILTSIEQNAIETASNYIDGETSIKIKFGSQMYDRIYDHYYIYGTVKAKNAVSKKNYNFAPNLEFTHIDSDILTLYEEFFCIMAVACSILRYGAKRNKFPIQPVRLRHTQRPVNRFQPRHERRCHGYAG